MSIYEYKYTKYKSKYLKLKGGDNFNENNIKNLMKNAKIPGLSIAILKDNNISLFNLGVTNNNLNTPITKKTVYLSASLSKIVFSYGVLKLVEKNILDLDKPLYSYTNIDNIDEILKKDDRYKKITTRMVLSHTSGLQNDGENKIAFDPGSKFLYSGDAFIYLQKIIEHITDKSINELMIENIFKPFDMINSNFIYNKKYEGRVITPHDHNGNIVNWKIINMDITKIKKAHVAGSLFTTSEDYGKFLIGLSKDEHILKMMTKKQIEINDNIYWGLGIPIELTNNSKVIWHWGDNLYFRHFVLYDPQAGNGFVLFTNSYNGLSIIDSITNMLYNKNFKAVLALKDLTEGRYLHEQYDNPLRISRLDILDEFLLNGLEKGIKKFNKWSKELSSKNKDQIDVLIENFNGWLYKKNKIFINAIISTNLLNNIDVIGSLGKGMHGTVYLVEDTNTNKKYGMKVEQILKKDMVKSSKSLIWREVEFAKTLSKKYPQQFMKIYKYENKKCKYVHSFREEIWNTMGEKQKKYYQRLFASSYCSIKLTSIIDNMLHDVIYDITDKSIILALFIQVIYIVYLMNKEGYNHQDFHPKNIGIVYTKDKYIKILNKKVPTYNYLLQAIDYGMVLHNKYQLEKWEENMLKYVNDLHINFYKIIFKIMLRNLVNKYPEININKIVPISKKDAKFLDQYLKNITIDNSKFNQKIYNYFQELLYKILFFDKFQEQLGVKTKVKLFEFIPIKSVIYYVNNINDIKKVLQHFIKLL